MAPKKNAKKIHIPTIKPRGTPAPAERVLPNPKKEELRKRARQPIKLEEIEE